MNKVILMGRLGKDPETKTFDGGGKVCNFPLATNKTYKDKKGEKQQSVTWHNCQVWNQLAEHCEKYLEKGRRVLLEGEISVSTWETDSGEKRYATRINVFLLTFLDFKEDSEKKNYKEQDPRQQRLPIVDNVQTNENFTADDIPF